MKSRFLYLILSAVQFGVTANAQSVLFRGPGVPIDQYRAALSSAFARLTPMDLLEKRLAADELPAPLQRRLDETLAAVTKEPARAADFFAAFENELETEPRSAAVRQAMQMVLERLRPESSAEGRREIERRLALLETVNHGSTSGSKGRLLQREIQDRLRALRNRPGGEDLVLFWNGVPWKDSLATEADQRSQWILVSSQWQPRLLSGTWADATQHWEEGFSDWVDGSCDQPGYRDLSLPGSIDRQALFADGCLTAPGGSGDPIASVTVSTLRGKSTKGDKTASGSTARIRPWIWGLGALAVGSLLLMASGKRLRIDRP